MNIERERERRERDIERERVTLREREREHQLLHYIIENNHIKQIPCGNRKLEPIVLQNTKNNF